MSLFEVFKKRKLKLPSVEKRKKLFSLYGFKEEYKGTATQNIALERAIQKDPKPFERFLKELQVEVKKPEVKVEKPKIEIKKPIVKKPSIQFGKISIKKKVSEKPIKFGKIELPKEKEKITKPKIEIKPEVKIKKPEIKVEAPKEKPKIKLVEKPVTKEPFPEAKPSPLKPPAAKLTKEIKIKPKAPKFVFKLPEKEAKITLIPQIKETLPTIKKQAESLAKTLEKEFKIKPEKLEPQITLGVLRAQTRQVKVAFNPQERVKKLTTPVTFKKLEEKFKEVKLPEVKTTPLAKIRVSPELIPGGIKLSETLEKKVKEIKKKEEKDSSFWLKEVDYWNVRLREKLSKLEDISVILDPSTRIVSEIKYKGKDINLQNLADELNKCLNQIEKINQAIKEGGKALSESEKALLDKALDIEKELAEATKVIQAEGAKISDSVYNLLTNPTNWDDPKAWSEFHSLFPKRKDFILGPAIDLEKIGEQEKTLKEKREEFEKLYDEKMQYYWNRLEALLKESEEKATRFLATIPEKDRIKLNRCVELAGEINEKDVLSKVANYYELAKNPSFKKALIKASKYLTGEKAEILKTLLRYDELVAEREEIENKVKNLYEKAIKDPELQKLAKQRERLIDYYTGLVSTFGNPSDQNSVAYALLKLGESLNEFHKAQLREELKRAEEESIYWKDFENMRTLTNFWKGVFVEAPKNLFKLGKELVWPFRKTDESPFVTVSWDFEKIRELAKKTTGAILPGGIVEYFYRGGARIDFDIFNKPGFNVLKFAWYDAPLKLAELTLTGMNSLIKDLTTTLAYFSLDPDLAKYFFPDKSVEEEIKSYSDDFLRAKVTLAALAMPKYPKLKDFFELPKEERLKPKNIIKFLSVLGSGDYGEYLVQESKRALEWNEFEVKFRGKLEDFLPPELEDFKAEYLFVNREYLNKELAPGTKILMPERNPFPVFLDFLDPSIRAELKKNKWTRAAMTAVEWLGFMRYTPACAFWVPATQMTHDLAA